MVDPTPATRLIRVRSDSTGAEVIPDWTDVLQSPFPVTVTSADNPVLTAAMVTDVSAAFVADPFLFHENGTWYMFFEVYDWGTARGKIGLATSSDGLNWQYDRIVLSESFHLSYPMVLKVDGRYFMIPETWEAGEVRLYEASNFPYSWHYSETLVAGRNFVDASVFYYNQMWWMFVSATGNSACYLYYSDDLTGGWVEHPRSPIVAGDSSKARLGGRSFVYDTDRVVRVVQKDDLYYGEQVRIFMVDVLNEFDYSEHEIPESPILVPSGSGWNANGMHHFDPWWTGDHWLCAVDGFGANDEWAIGIYVASHSSSPNGTITSPSGDVTIDVGGVVVFEGTGSDPDGDFPLSYRWSFGAGSGIPDSLLEDPGPVQFTTPGTFTVTLTVSDAQGFTDPTPATRTITVRSGSGLLPQSGWTLKYADSQELAGENGAAVNAFDNNSGTIWHTQWVGASPSHPHEIQINLGAVYEIDGFRYLPRQDGSANGRIAQYEFYVSSDGTNWGTAAATGVFASTAGEKEVTFTPRTGRYIRLRALSEVNGNPWTSAAEIRALGR
jgi:hypothetical protein